MNRLSSSRRDRTRSLVAAPTVVVIAAALLAAADARAEPLRLALGVDQGVLLPRAYGVDIVAIPAVDFGPMRLAVDLGAAFQNPDWAGIVGVRPSVVVWAPVTPSTGIRLVTDVSYLTLHSSWRWTGGFAIDFESIHVGFLAGLDSFHDGGVLLTTLAFDIPTIVRFVLDDWFASAPGACAAK